MRSLPGRCAFVPHRSTRVCCSLTQLVVPTAVFCCVTDGVRRLDDIREAYIDRLTGCVTCILCKLSCD